MRLLFLIFTLLWGTAELSAQCNHTFCGSPGCPPSVNAEDAPVFCDLADLNGFAGATGTFNGGNVPSGFCGAIENSQWLGFVAPVPSVTITLQVSNCAGTSGGSGLQMQIFGVVGDCADYIPVSPCFGTGTVENGTLTADGLVVGDTYLILIDGWSGDMCDYTIVVEDGMAPTPTPPTPSPIAGPSTVCPGGTAVYSVDPVQFASEYVWTLSPPSIGTISGNGTPQISIDYNGIGGALLEVYATNGCAQSDPVELLVVSTPPVMGPPDTVYYCLGDPAVWQGDVYANPTPGLQTQLIDSYLGCDSIVSAIFFPVVPPTTDLGDIYLCPGESISVGGLDYSDENSYSIILMDESFRGCDSTVNFNIFIETVVAEISPDNPEIGCDGSGSVLDGSSSQGNDLSYEWLDASGSMVATGVTYSVNAPGEYALVVIGNNAGCTDTATVNVVGGGVFPTIAGIDGDAQYCAGMSTQTYTATGVSDADTIIWNVPTGADFTIDSPDATQITVNWNGFSGQVCAMAQNDCGQSNAVCLGVSTYDPATITFLNAPTLCDGTAALEISLTGTAPWQLAYAIDGVAQTPVTILSSPNILSVSDAGIYTVIGLADGNNCNYTSSAQTEVFPEDPLLLSDLNYDCNPTGDAYQIQFTLSGGDPGSYQVTGVVGAFTGNAFLSEAISSGSGFSLQIADGNACDTILLSEAEIICACTTEVGTMDPAPLIVCDDATATATYDGNHTFDGNDGLVFVLHEGSDTIVVDELDRQPQPDFSFLPGMSYGTTYYISAVVANQLPDGTIDFTNDPCADVAAGTPVTWFQSPEVTLSGDTTICQGGSVELTVIVPGFEAVDLILENSQNSQFTFDALPPGTHTLMLTPGVPTTYTILAVGGTQCPASGTGSASVDFYQGITLEEVSIDESTDGTSFQVCVTLSGGPQPYRVNGVPFSGNQYCTPDIACGMGYDLLLEDDQGCSDLTVATPMFVCNCSAEVGTMAGDSLFICEGQMAVGQYDASGENLLPGDTLLFVLHSSPTNQLGNLVAQNDQPVFAFDPLTMQHGVTYYLSALVADADADGFDETDGCLQLSLGTPVTFYLDPTLAVVADQTQLCAGDSVVLSFTPGGSGTVFQVDVGSGTGLVETGSTLAVYPTQDTLLQFFEILSLQSNCATDLSGTLDLNIQVETPASAGTVLEMPILCATLDTTLQLTELLQNADPDGSWSSPDNPTGFEAATGSFTIPGNAPGTYEFLYTVGGSGLCAPATSTILVELTTPPVVSAGPDQTLSCTEENVTLSADDPVLEYLWTDESGAVLQTGVTYTTSQPGSYFLTGSDAAGCSGRDTVMVLPAADLVQPVYRTEAVSCFGQADATIAVDTVVGGTGPYLFSLNDAPYSSNSVFELLEAGSYELRTLDALGCEVDTVIQLQGGLDLQAFLEGDFPTEEQSLVFGDSLDIRLFTTAANTDSLVLNWSPAGLISCDSCTTQTILPTESGRVEVMVSVGECSTVASLEFLVTESNDLFVPNAFSPNGNGANDRLILSLAPSVERVTRVLIYDRWGTQIFEQQVTSDARQIISWDGQVQGDLAPNGVYIYAIEYLRRDGEIKMTSGDIMLVK